MARIDKMNNLESDCGTKIVPEENDFALIKIEKIVMQIISNNSDYYISLILLLSCRKIYHFESL